MNKWMYVQVIYSLIVVMYSEKGVHILQICNRGYHIIYIYIYIET